MKNHTPNHTDDYKVAINNENVKAVERRPFDVLGHIHDLRTSKEVLQCPFCNQEVHTEVFSFSAWGETCECGAVFSPNGFCKKSKEESE